MNLRAIGIDVVTKRFPSDALLTRINTSGEPWDLHFPLSWGADYPDPEAFLAALGHKTLHCLRLEIGPSAGSQRRRYVDEIP